jgi:hypothetical protein
MTTEPTELALITVHFAREKLQALESLANSAMTWERTDEDSTDFYYQAVFETTEDQERFIDALDSAIARDPEFAGGYWLE